MTTDASKRTVLKYLSQPRTVVVDNDPDDLEGIRKGLSKVGLECVTMLYDKMAGLIVPDVWEPNRLRLVFLDLNLDEVENPDVSRMTGFINEVLEQLKPSGVSSPYLLVFWTKHKDLAQSTMQCLYERHPDTQLPFQFLTLEKETFQGKNGYDVEALKNKIVTMISQNKVFLAMLIWESEVERAATRTFDGLHGLIAARQADGTAQNSQDLLKVLKHLGAAAWGKKNAEKNPGGAITSGLAPLLLDHLDSIIGEDDYKDAWNGAIPGSWSSKLPENVPAARLNAQCLIDLNCSDPECRGAWLEFSTNALGEPLEGHFGKTRNQLAEEFINPGKNQEADDIRASVKLGLLECTAACDYLNNKAPMRRYILCGRIPVDKLNYVTWSGPNRERKHDAIHRLEAITMGDGEFELFLDFRYVLHLPPQHTLLTSDMTSIAFRVRSQVLADISARYAAHTTRPGTLAFASKRKKLSA